MTDEQKNFIIQTNSDDIRSAAVVTVTAAAATAAAFVNDNDDDDGGAHSECTLFNISDRIISSDSPLVKQTRIFGDEYRKLTHLNAKPQGKLLKLDAQVVQVIDTQQAKSLIKTGEDELLNMGAVNNTSDDNASLPIKEREEKGLDKDLTTIDDAKPTITYRSFQLVNIRGCDIKNICKNCYTFNEKCNCSHL